MECKLPTELRHAHLPQRPIEVLVLAVEACKVLEPAQGKKDNPRSVKGVRFAPRRKLKHPRDLVDVIVRPVPRSLDNKVIVAIKLAHRLKRER